MLSQIEMIRRRSFWNRNGLSASRWVAHYCIVAAAVLLLLGAAPQAYAQQTGTVATVDSRLFPTEILEYKKRIEQLNQEFQDRTREVQKLAADLRSYEIDLNTNRLNYTEPIRRER